MMRRIRFQGIFINAKTTRCAHACRYCSIGSKEFSDLPFNRYAALVEDLIRWTERERPDLSVYPAVNDSYDFDHETKIGLPKLRARAGKPFDLITTGGLRMRSQEELREWLLEWQELGIACIHATYAGFGAIHDRFNGRSGDFEWLLHVQRLAGGLGFSLGQSLFLTKSTLPSLSTLISRLDELTGQRRYRWIFPIAYVGLGARLEKDRIDEDDRDVLPESYYDRKGDWWSEREWMGRADPQAEPQIDDVVMRLAVTEHNIARLEQTPWPEIIADVEARTSAVYEVIPTFAELRASVGDRNNRRVYDDRQEIERVWVDRYLIRNRIEVDRRLSPLTVWRPSF